jgi:AcrR family transcriptional regulator
VTPTETGISPRTSARDRLLSAANELFYDEGIHTVGIDRVIEKAGVAKASLYSTFGSKDELIRAYLQGRHATRRERIERHMALHESARDKLVSVFDALGESVTQPGYHGCAFHNASAEAPTGSPILQATQEYRGWVRGLLVDLAGQAGAASPAALANQLMVLYDGAAVSARIDEASAVAADAKAAATVLIDAACGTARRRSAREG